MGLTILLITLIVLTCLFVIFLGRDYGDADANKPTFIRINDDEGLNYIFNTSDIRLITAFNNINGKNNKYIITVCLKDNTNISFKYDDQFIRNKIYDALSDYNIYDKLKSNE